MNNPEVLLFFPKHWLREFRPPTQAPLGLMMISDYIIKKGYNVKIIDERLTKINIQDFKTEIKNAKIFGVSAQSGPQINNGLLACKYVRKINFNIKIIWGGVHATLLPEQTLENPLIDIIVIGEGEATFSELTEAILKDKPLKNIQGVGYKDKGKIIINPRRELIDDINKIDIRWDLVNHKDYIQDFEGRKSLSTITSRGCFFRCSFCYNQVFFGKRYFRGYTAKKVMEEVKRFVDWGVETIKFEDDNMLVDKKRAREICNLIIKEKYNIFWSAPIRADYFDDEFISLLKKSGFKYCNIGAESGSKRILNLMHKDTDPKKYLKAARIGKKYDIDLSYHWILGYPTETLSEVYETVNLIKEIEEINPKAYNILNIFAPYPGTESYDLAIEKGFSPPESLENWTINFREECNNLKYVDNGKLLENIRISGILKTLAKRTVWYKPIYRPFMKVAGGLQDLRWKYNYFNMPLEINTVKLFKNKFME